MNQSVISGRLTKDPECKEFNEGKIVCDFTVAVNGYKKEDTIYIKVKAWGNRAKSCGKFCKKGSLVNVSGALRENSWKTKEGNQRKELYILASDVEFVQRPQESTDNNSTKIEESNEKPNKDIPQVTEEELEQVPF